MGAPVPANDLPANAVPADDLPAPKDFLKEAAPYYLGPMGAPRALRDMSHALDAAAYSAGGKVTDLTGSPAAGLAANVAVQAVPSVVGGGAAAKLAPALETGARSLMQSAMKPTLEALRTGKASRAIDTMLEEGVNVTKGGIEKLRAQIGELNQQIADAIASSPATVDKGKVASELQGTLNKFLNQVNPNADRAAIEKAWNEFLTHPLLTGVRDIPVQLAQKLKQGTYKALGEKSYGELKGAEIEAQKTLARGLKEGVAEAVPRVAPLNARESDLLNALNVAQRRVLMDGNKNPAGLGILHPETMALWLADRSPLAKSLLARMLYSGSEQIPATAGRTVGATVGSQYLGRQPTLQELLNEKQ